MKKSKAKTFKEKSIKEDIASKTEDSFNLDLFNDIVEANKSKFTIIKLEPTKDQNNK